MNIYHYVVRAEAKKDAITKVGGSYKFTATIIDPENSVHIATGYGHSPTAYRGCGKNGTAPSVKKVVDK